jgi:cbb3-type cytochrome oxidase maturation protein
MNILVYLVPMALGLGLAGLFAFLWALKSGQYNDVEGAALRVLSDDDIEKSPARPRESGEVDSHSKCNTWEKVSAGVFQSRHFRGVLL